MAVMKFVLFALLFECVFCVTRQKRIVGGNEEDTPPLPTDNVEEDRGADFEDSGNSTAINNIKVVKRLRSAKFKGSLEPEGYHAFQGIRYAEPPVKNYRFQVRYYETLITRFC